jgi:hypothetical protein
LNDASPAARVFGGWQATFFCRYTDGLPLAIVSGNSLAAFGYPGVRANYVGGPAYAKTNPRDFNPAVDVYLNAAAFAAPSTFQLGNTARVLDWVRGLSQKSESVSIARQVPLKERLHAVLRADVQNPFNFVRWSNPNTNITSSLFGRVTAAAGGRSIQLGLALEF